MVPRKELVTLYFARFFYLFRMVLFYIKIGYTFKVMFKTLKCLWNFKNIHKISKKMLTSLIICSQNFKNVHGYKNVYGFYFKKYIEKLVTNFKNVDKL